MAYLEWVNFEERSKNTAVKKNSKKAVWGNYDGESFFYKKKQFSDLNLNTTMRE